MVLSRRPIAHSSTACQVLPPLFFTKSNPDLMNVAPSGRENRHFSSLSCISSLDKIQKEDNKTKTHARRGRKETHASNNHQPASQKEQSASPFLFLSMRPSPFPPQRNGKGTHRVGLLSRLFSTLSIQRVSVNEREGGSMCGFLEVRPCFLVFFLFRWLCSITSHQSKGTAGRGRKRKHGSSLFRPPWPRQ